jgi:lysophospholipase II
MAEFAQPHVASPTSKHTNTIILLHGRGSNGPEFAEELFEARTSKGLSLQEHLPGWKWVFPSSQTRYSTLFQEDMDEWFDIYSLTDTTLREELQVEGLQQSVAFIHQLIQAEAKHVPLANIVLGGISQGCATAVHAMLSLKGQNIGAFVGFCGWMPFASSIQDSHTSSFGMGTLRDITKNRQRPPIPPLAPSSVEPSTELEKNWHTPPSLLVPPPLPSNGLQPLQPVSGSVIFLGHSKNDEVVDFGLGVQLRSVLQQLGAKVSWREYDDGGHWIKEPQGFDDLIDFLATNFGLAFN